MHPTTFSPALSHPTTLAKRLAAAGVVSCLVLSQLAWAQAGNGKVLSGKAVTESNLLDALTPAAAALFETDARLECASVFGDAAAAIENVALLTYATPRIPDDALAAPLAAAGIAVMRIGDCKVARNVLDATAEGYAAGMAL